MTTYDYSPVTVPLVRSGVFVLRSRGVLSIYNETSAQASGRTIGTICGDTVGFAEGVAQIEFADGTTITAGPAPTEAGFQRNNPPVAAVYSFPGNQLILWQTEAGDAGVYSQSWSYGQPRGAVAMPSVASYSSSLALDGEIIGAVKYGGVPLACSWRDNDYPPTADTLCLSTSGTLELVQPWQGPDENYYYAGSIWAVGDYLATGKFTAVNAFWQNTFYFPYLVTADSGTGATVAALEISGLSDLGHDVLWTNAAENGDAIACNIVTGAPYACPYGFMILYLDWLFVIAADASWYEAYNLQVSPYDAVGVETYGQANEFPFGLGELSAFLSYDDTGVPYAYLLNSDTVPGELLSGGLAGPQLLPLAIPLVLQCVPCAPVLFDPPG